MLERDEARKEKCKKKCLNRENLNDAQKQKFWEELKKIFKKNNEQMILPRKDDDGNFMTSTDEMEEKI